MRALRIEHLEDRRPLAADFNGDETVDEFDLRNWQAGYGMMQVATERGDADGDGDADGRDFLQFQREFGPTQNNLIPYRPQSVQKEGNPTGAPIYDPFKKKPVPAADEVSSTVGPGIRINYDDDNQNGTEDALEQIAVIPQENDLIEVKIEHMAGTGDLVLAIGNRLRVYRDHEKSSLLVATGGTSEVLPFINNRLTVFVEWIDNNHGTDTLSLVEPGTATTYDTVRFHSFRSLVIVFGGNGQDPADADDDGSIGDPVPSGPAGNREGIFDVAQSLYDIGWDVLAFDEEDWDHPDDIPYREAKNAIENRLVGPDDGGGIGLIGYSQGGGAVHDMIDRLLIADNIITTFGVMLDAVDHDGASPEVDWPEAAFYLLNIYEEILEFPTLGGGDIDDSEVFPGAILEEVNVTIDAGWDHGLDHFAIDDDPQVQQLIRARLSLFLPDR